MSPEFDKNTSFTISKASVDNIEAVTRLLAQSWMETYPNIENDVTIDWIKERYSNRLSPESIAKRQKKFLEDEHNPDIGSFIAKDLTGNIIGFASCFRNDNEGKQRIGAIYVDSGYHGKGVAHGLMEKSLSMLDLEKPIFLGVVTYNERAKRFYSKWGFEEIQGSESLFDDKLPSIEMVRKGKQDEIQGK